MLHQDNFLCCKYRIKVVSGNNFYKASPNIIHPTIVDDGPLLLHVHPEVEPVGLLSASGTHRLVLIQFGVQLATPSAADCKRGTQKTQLHSRLQCTKVGQI